MASQTEFAQKIVDLAFNTRKSGDPTAQMARILAFCFEQGALPPNAPNPDETGGDDALLEVPEEDLEAPSHNASPQGQVVDR